jgi:hypothetical protein
MIIFSTQFCFSWGYIYTVFSACSMLPNMLVKNLEESEMSFHLPMKFVWQTILISLSSGTSPLYWIAGNHKVMG